MENQNLNQNQNLIFEWIQKINDLKEPLSKSLLHNTHECKCGPECQCTEEKHCFCKENQSQPSISLTTELGQILEKIPPLVDFVSKMGGGDGKFLVEFLKGGADSSLYLENLVAVFQSLKDIPRIDSISEIDWNLYLGSWEQVFAGAFSILAVEHAGINNNAYYRLLDENTISIYNTQKTIDGRFNGAKGVATIESPGQLSVRFGESPVSAPYWIVALGPIVDNQYQWSVVSDPYRINLYILARQRQIFEEEYQEEVLRIVQELGFSYAWNSPVPTV